MAPLDGGPRWNMVDNTARDGGDVQGSADRSDSRPISVRAVVETYDDRPPECTLFPVDVLDEDERLTSWITAIDDAFVGLEAAR